MITAIAILKTLGGGHSALEKLGMSYIDCGTSGGVYGLERGYCLMVGGTNFAVSASPIFRSLAPGIGCSQNRSFRSMKHLLSMVGYTADHQVLVTL